MANNKKADIYLLLYLMVSSVFAFSLIVFVLLLFGAAVGFFKAGVFYFGLEDLKKSIRIGLFVGSVAGIGIWVMSKFKV